MIAAPVMQTVQVEPGVEVKPLLTGRAARKQVQEVAYFVGWVVAAEDR
jgi:hypothetical protein